MYDDFKLVIGAIVGVLAVVVVSCLGCGSCGTVDTGHRGIVTKMGSVTGEIKGEGFYWKSPFIESVVPMDVRIQKEQVPTSGASRDLQSVNAIVALNLRVDPDKCDVLYQTIGVDYMDSYVGPALQESIKAALAQYTAEELVTKREAVREAIITLVASKLKIVGIIPETINIVDFKFSESFNEAIEAKVTAEQKALAAKNALVQKEFEAKQSVVLAKGKAEAMQAEAAALRDNPQMMQLRALERWNGVLPQVTTGAVPFISLDKLGK